MATLFLGIYLIQLTQNPPFSPHPGSLHGTWDKIAVLVYRAVYVRECDMKARRISTQDRRHGIFQILNTYNTWRSCTSTISCSPLPSTAELRALGGRRQTPSCSIYAWFHIYFTPRSWGLDNDQRIHNHRTALRMRLPICTYTLRSHVIHGTQQCVSP